MNLNTSNNFPPAVTITNEYREFYRQAFASLRKDFSFEQLYESAFPSYVNPNPFISWFFWRRTNAAISLCGDEIRGKRVLDFGCGLGVTFLWLVNQQCKIVGCDIEYAQAARKTAGMLNGDISVISDLDEVAGPFDYILALDVLEHVINLEEIVARFKELSESGARLIVSGPTETPLYKLGRFIPRYESHSHKRNINDIEQVLSSAGLELIKAKRLFPVAPLFRVTMWKFK